MNQEDSARLRALLNAPVNPTGWPLLHLVAMFYPGSTAEAVGLPMRMLDSGDWEVVVPFDGRLFRVDRVYAGPETSARSGSRGADRHEEFRAGETVQIGAIGQRLYSQVGPDSSWHSLTL